MAEDWKTIRVPETVFEHARDEKDEHGDTWGSVLSFYVDHRGGDAQSPTMTVEAEDMRPMISEEIAKAMSEVTLDVTIDGDSDMNEEDVRNIVDAKLDVLKSELRH